MLDPSRRAVRRAVDALLPRTVRATLVAVAVVIAAPTALLEVRAHQRELEEHRRLELQAGLELARASVVAFQAFLHDVESELRALGLALAAPPDRRPDPEALLGAAAADHPSVAEFDWFGTDGALLAASTDADGTNADAPPARPPRTVLEAAMSAGVLVSDLFSTEQGPVFFIARVVQGADGRAAGVMTAAIPAARVGFTTLRHDRAGGGGSVTLVDSTGRIVYTRPEVELGWDARMLLTPEGRRVGQELVAEGLLGREATGVLASAFDGRPRLAAVTPIPTTGWAAVASRNEAEALAGVRRELLVRAAVFAAVLGAGLATAFALARRISRPLLALARRASRGAPGGPPVRPELREIRALAGALTRQRRQIALRERRLAQARGEAEAAAEGAEREAALLDSMLESAPHPIILYESTGAVGRMNAAAAALLGYTDEERRLSPERPEALARLRTPAGGPLPWRETPIGRALTGEIVHGVELRLDAAGAPHRPTWVSVSAAPVRGPHGEVDRAVAMIVDVTQVKELQEQRDDLLRVVSHDLRSPLAAVAHQANLALHRPGDAAWVSGRARAILVATRRMNAMIQDLLDAARFERGELALELAPVDLRRFVPELLAHLDGSLPVSRVRVHVAEDVPPVRADTNRLERILVNLLSNALKYSDDEVELGVRREADGVVITVSDRGAGIPSAEVPGLFERFSRTARRRAHGVGLGLYSARVLAEAHGGGISVTTAPGHGTVFSVALPRGAGS